ncbi:hypothetical protein BGZ81_010886 [Podila clonocystis]|nr:hypothetical protein BGZ81_010886 [Podila clonocystis]
MSEYSAYRHNSKNSRPDHRPHKDEEAGFTTVYDLDQATPHSDTVSSSSTTEFSSSHHTSGHDENKWKHLRLKVMRMATVKRLQLLWGLLALFGTMSWISLMPAYAFRNKVEPDFKSPVYAFFVVATVGTSLSAIWQSLCPFLIRQSQRALLPRIINHPATQTATILISVILTILNFFSWIILASNKEAGAKTNCETGPFSGDAGYVAQCRGVNVAIVLDVIVFFLWIPISVVIVCGTIERGLWWWGEDDGAHAEAIVKGSNMMSEEEFDLKISGQGQSIKRRQTVHPENLRDQQIIQQPKPAFVTPIASQFRSTTGDVVENNEDEEYFTPSSYRRHQRQRKQQQQQQQQQALQPGETRRGLTHRASNSSLSSRLSTFFGAGWGTGQMPPEAEDQPPMPQIPSQYRQESSAIPPTSAPATATTASSSPTRVTKDTTKAESKQEAESEDVSASLHGDGYTSQWHSRRYDDWS